LRTPSTCWPSAASTTTLRWIGYRRAMPAAAGARLDSGAPELDPRGGGHGTARSSGSRRPCPRPASRRASDGPMDRAVRDDQEGTEHGAGDVAGVLRAELVVIPMG